MTTQHTPGPWAFSQSAQYGDTRFYVAQGDGAPYTPHYSDVATLIAETVNDERRSIQEANARLIAAAPDLLDALKKVMPFIDCIAAVTREEIIEYEAAMKMADAAIKKATGQE
jgi:hypothetical protein